MTAWGRVTQVACNTSTGNQDITINGIGTPKAAMFYLTPAIAQNTAVDHARLSVGATDGTNSRVIHGRTRTGVTTSDTRRRGRTAAVCQMYAGTATTIEAEASFSQWITDGVRINWSTAPPAGWLLTVVLFGGSDVSAYVGDFATSGTNGGTNDVTAPGFKPSMVFSFGNGTGLNNSDQTHHPLNLGVAVRGAADSITQRGASWATLHSSTSHPVTAAIDNRYFQVNLNPAGGYSRSAELTLWLSNGFRCTMRQGDTAAALTLAYLALDFGSGVQCWTDTLGMPTATGSQSITGPGFEPQMFGALGVPVQTLNASVSGASYLATVADQSGHGSQAIRAVNGASPSSDAISRANSAFAYWPVASATAIGTASISAWTSTGVTLNWTAVVSDTITHNAIVWAVQAVSAPGGTTHDGAAAATQTQAATADGTRIGAPQTFAGDSDATQSQSASAAGQLLTGGATAWLHRNRYTTPDAAPVDDPLPSSGTDAVGSADILDTGNRFSVSSGMLLVASGGSWNNPAEWSGPFTRTDVGIITRHLRVHGTTELLGSFVHSSAAPSNPHQTAWGVNVQQQGFAYRLSLAPFYEEYRLYGQMARRTRSIDYLITHVIENDRQHIIVSGGLYGQYPNGRLVWSGGYKATDLYHGITGQNNAGWRSSDVAIAPVEDVPTEWQSYLPFADWLDSFGGSGSMSGRSPETGSSTWSLATDNTNNGTVASGEVVKTSASQRLVAYVDPGTTARIHKLRVRASSSGTMHFGLLFRGTGTGMGDFQQLQYFQGGGYWGLYNGSGWSGQYTGLTPVAGRIYEFIVVDKGQTIDIMIYDEFNDTYHWPSSWRNMNHNVNTSGTRVGFFSWDNDLTAFLDFGSIPNTDENVLLPELLEDLAPTVVLPTGSAIATEAFSDSGNLNSTTTDTGGYTWQATGTWSSNGSVASRSTTGTFESLLIDVGTPNHAVEATISLPNVDAPNESYAGVFLRYKDVNNWIHARFLDQGENSEIELFQCVAGSATIVTMTNHGFSIHGTTRVVRAAVRDVVDDGISRVEVTIWERAVGDTLDFDDPNTVYLQGFAHSSLIDGTKCGIGAAGSGGTIVQATYDNVTVWETSVASNDLAAPTNLSIVSFTDTSAIISWTDNATGEDRYAVEISDDNLNWSVVVDNLPANSTSYEITGLDPATQYWVRVRAGLES
jgi:hypothetical protein